MATTEMNCLAGGGGSSVASGSGEVTSSTASTPIKIETGLASITRFSLIWEIDGKSWGVGSLTWFTDRMSTVTNYFTAFMNERNSSINGGAKAVGTVDAITYGITDISEINSGNITIKPSTQSGFDNSKYWWYAE